MDVMFFTLKPFKQRRVIRRSSDTRSGEFDVSAPNPVPVLSRDKYQKHCDWMPTKKKKKKKITVRFSYVLQPKQISTALPRNSKNALLVLFFFCGVCVGGVRVRECVVCVCGVCVVCVSDTFESWTNVLCVSCYRSKRFPAGCWRRA